MNYFRCTVGGSGKGNTVTVTCAEEFAGLTITLSKTGKTYTKTCPSTAPYVVTFNGVENGTYTVSCIVDGQTYSETVIVQDISCVLNYGFTWRTWVDTASQLDSSDYDTLDEVLADEKALRELFLEHACVDYMASVAASNADLETIINDDYCAKWINLSDYALDYLNANEVIADLMDEADKYFYGEWVITDPTTIPPTWGPKGNVPVMTSSSAPYGTVIYKNYANDQNVPYMAFDNNLSTNWTGQQNDVTNQYIGYKFTNPTKVKKAKFTHQGKRVGTAYIQGSNDNSNWVTLSETYTNDDTSYDLFQPEISVNSEEYYMYYRLFIPTTNATDYTSVKELQFYGRELKVSVPKMTSNTAPYGEASADSAYDNTQAAWKAFDNDDGTTNWHSTQTSFPHWLEYDFKKPTSILFVKMTNRKSGSAVNIHAPKNFTIECYDEGNWVSVGAYVNDTNATGAIRYYIPEQKKTSSKWRINITSELGSTNTYSSIGDLQFYGLDYSEKEFEVGTTKKWLYDHGVELESISPAVTTGGTITEGNDFITLDRTNSNANVSIATDSTIDISSYSKFFSIVDTIKNSSIELIAVGSSRTSGTSGTTANKVVSMIGGNVKDCLDVSSINQSLYPVIFADNVGAFNIKELWLE